MVRSKAKKARASAKAPRLVAAADTPAVIAATNDYERWLHKRLDVVDPDLKAKHEDMAGSPFAFLRGTFYRWVPLWLEVCPGLAETPTVLAVGDLHVENFGTWRDAEGRLVWGVNDFDEVARMPYAIDLVRLVTSAILAKRENDLAIDPSDAAAGVLEGYTDSLEKGGNPFILEESHPSLRAMATGAEREPNSVLVQDRQASTGDAAQKRSASAPAVVAGWGRGHRFLLPHRRRGQPWAPTLRGDGQLPWWPRRARSEGVVAVCLGLGHGTDQGARQLRQAA